MALDTDSAQRTDEDGGANPGDAEGSRSETPPASGGGGGGGFLSRSRVPPPLRPLVALLSRVL